MRSHREGFLQRNQQPGSQFGKQNRPRSPSLKKTRCRCGAIANPKPLSTRKRGYGPDFGLGVLTSSHRPRSEEHTSELQSLMRISYAVFCLKKKKNKKSHH